MDSLNSTMITVNRSHNPILTEKDIKEIVKIERKREMELQRKQRIFNTKSRLFGVDTLSLEKQVKEKADRTRFEQLEHEKHVLLAKRLAEKAVEEEQRAVKDKRKMCRLLDEYRLIHQKRQFSRDYDLEKPSSSDRSKIGGDDNRFGVTIFEGEDDHKKERETQQKNQQRTWLLQQMLERDRIKTALKNKDRLYEDTYIERDIRSRELMEMENYCRIKMEKANYEYNKAMANKKIHEKKLQRKNDTNWDSMEILNTVTSDLLQENPDLAKSSLGPNRINTMMYKGMSEEAISEIRATQKSQIEEKVARKIREQHDEKSWDNYDHYVLEVTAKAEREKDQKLQSEKKKLENYNELLGARQRESEKYRNNVVNSNQVTEDYYSQFNTGSR